MERGAKVISKTEYAEMKRKLEFIESYINDIDGGFERFDKEHPMYEAYTRLVEKVESWKKYQNMTLEQRKDIVKQWDEYYTACRNSEMGNLVRKGQELLSQGRTEALNELAETARKTPCTPAPEFPDPQELAQWVGGYLSAKSRVIQMRDIIEFHAQFYEKKEKQDNSSGPSGWKGW